MYLASLWTCSGGVVGAAITLNIYQNESQSKSQYHNKQDNKARFASPYHLGPCIFTFEAVGRVAIPSMYPDKFDINLAKGHSQVDLPNSILWVPYPRNEGKQRASRWGPKSIPYPRGGQRTSKWGPKCFPCSRKDGNGCPNEVQILYWRGGDGVSGGFRFFLSIFPLNMSRIGNKG